jgi:hypothetical protein
MTHTDAEELQAEVERLRAENAKLGRRVAWRLRARRASVVFLLVLGCGLAVLSLLAIWLRVTLLDTDRYVDTVAPLAAEPPVQRAVATKLKSAIDSKVDYDGLIRQALPDRADVLAPAIGTGLKSFVDTRIDQFTQSERFQTVWTEANRRAHDRVLALLEGGRSKRLLLNGDTVYLDLSSVVDRVRDRLRSRGLDRIADAIPPTVNGQVALFSSDALPKAQRGVRLLKALAIVLPVVSVLALLGSILLTRPWRRGLLHAAIGVAVAMLVLIAALAVARSAYLGALDQGVLPRDAASDIFDTVAALLRHGVRIVVLASIVLALIALVAGLPLRRLGAAGWARVGASPVPAWTARYRDRLMIAAGALGMLLLLIWSPLTGGVVLVVLLIVAAACGAIAAVAAASQAGDAVTDELGPDDEQEHGHDRGVVGGHP